MAEGEKKQGCGCGGCGCGKGKGNGAGKKGADKPAPPGGRKNLGLRG